MSLKSKHVVIVGAGAGGLAAAASLRKRAPALGITVIDPAEQHFYQPGWTMVGAGIFTPEETARPMEAVIPSGVTRIKAAVADFEPEKNRVSLSDGRRLDYDAIVVSPGLELDWAAIPGLEETLGRNGVTSNYRFDLAPYTASLVDKMRSGRAIFTQPPMPIKCAGAPQKAMYLSADTWRRDDRLGAIEIAFHNANPSLFGVATYVPPLMDYIRRYAVDLQLGSRLVSVDGDAKVATFETVGEGTRREERFDFLHVCPPQVAPDIIRKGALANETGFLAVHPRTLQHLTYANVFGLGDAIATGNAKTAAAARKQAPVVARNLIATLKGDSPVVQYDGYGSCPLTVEHGRILLAEFGYDGVLQPTFPKWLIDGTRPSRLAWALKRSALPRIYWDAMLKGREWLASPTSAGMAAR
jgi:sulfide:quinone oxidoreductase